MGILGFQLEDLEADLDGPFLFVKFESIDKDVVDDLLVQLDLHLNSVVF